MKRLTMPWGKHKGRPIEDIPSDYLEWCLRETQIADQHPDVAEEMQVQLGAREGHGIVRRER